MQRRRAIVGVSCAAAVAAAALIAASLAGSHGSAPETTKTRATTTVAAPTPESSVLAGIPQRGTVLGIPDAPVTVYEFADIQCPFCANFSSEVLPSVVRDYVRTGRIRLDFRVLEFLGPDSDRGARAVLAAGQQNLAWNLLEGLYALQGAENSGWLSDGALREVAGGVPGLDVDRMLADMPKMTAALQRAASHANELGVRGTPSFYVKPPLADAEDLGLSSLSPGGFRAAIEPLLA